MVTSSVDFHRLQKKQKQQDRICVMSPIHFLLAFLKTEKWDFWVLEHVLLDEVYLNNVQYNIISQFIQAPSVSFP